MSYLKVWGCEAYVHHEIQDKLESRSKKCLFVGYPANSYGYLFYDPSENKVFVARRAVFLEKDLKSKRISGNKVDLEEIQDLIDMETDLGTDYLQEVDVPEIERETDIMPPPVRRSDKERHAPERYGLNISKGNDACNGSDEPVSYQEAMAGHEAAKWQEAMDTEIQSMHDNQVWTLWLRVIHAKIWYRLR